MKDIISKYKNGSKLAEDQLLDSIMETYNHNLTRQEAIMLLHKKYGKTEKF